MLEVCGSSLLWRFLFIVEVPPCGWGLDEWLAKFSWLGKLEYYRDLADKAVAGFGRADSNFKRVLWI